MTLQTTSYQKFIILLRNALNISNALPTEVSAEEWKEIYKFAQQQALLGVVFECVKKLEVKTAPSFTMQMQWVSATEQIRGLNKKFYAECQRLTRLFEDNGRKTVILKGQANSILYPDQFIRHPGDIDIYVEGGKKSVIQLLDTMGLLSKEEEELMAYHHVHLEHQDNGIVVEVHFRPSSGFYNPFRNQRLQNYLLEEVKALSLTEKGFYVPTMKFALAMQLAHLQRHFIERNIGLRQITDYYILLKNSTPDDRNDIANMLDKFGAKRFAGALMYLLQVIFDLDKSLMLCTPDEKRGETLLAEVINGDEYVKQRAESKASGLANLMERKIHTLKFSTLYPSETCWYFYYKSREFFAKLPLRIKNRSWSLQLIRK